LNHGTTGPWRIVLAMPWPGASVRCFDPGTTLDMISSQDFTSSEWKLEPEDDLD
jgi:hypothetical protein